MAIRNGTLAVRLDSTEGARIRKALAAEQRVKLLGLLGRRAMNINEIAAGLGVSQPTVSVHIRVLEEAGLVECEYSSSSRGSEKRCWARYDSIVYEIGSDKAESDGHVEEIAMPVGLYSSVSVLPTCGLASAERVIGFLDNPQSFLLPARSDAQIIWFASGWVEYTFPCDLPPTARITGLELVAEVCSEAPNYDHEWPSDITVWINGVEVGTWVSPGDFGGKRGRLNPEWWSDSLTQYGALKSWSVNGSGSFVDGTPCGRTALSDLEISYARPISVRIGNKEGATHSGGLNLFGRHFGNYPQDLTLRLRYSVKTSRQVTQSVKALLESPAPGEALQDP